MTLRNLSSSYFMGSIPASLGNDITQLAYLDLSFNSFSGHIPSSFSNLQQLRLLDLRGSVELYDFAKLKKLKALYLSNISLSMSTKLTVNSSFPNLSELGLRACNISEFPSWMWDIGVHTLIYLELSRNFLTNIDHLPWKNLEYLHLDSNLLQGSLLNLPPHMREFSISRNNLTGEIPSSFCNLSYIRFFDSSNNSLSGQILQCLGNSTLDTLDLGMNNFQGSVQQIYTKGCKLVYLRLSGNHLEGPLPPSLINCVDLQFLDVGNNSLSGPIPEYLGNSTLEILDMRMNKFSGSLPQTFAKSCVLVSLNLNGNRLEGPLPPSLVNCRHLEVIDVGNNQINDTFPHWLDVLPELQVLTLRSNRFRGPIDDTKTRVPFPKLRIIDLSYNRFTGVLPIWYLHGFKVLKSII
ncbi:receptor-like protein 11 [Citrus sinensis]|uniref:receptor-like protein 11 n=1 Tax=Citrus sinensis TaxID=2711 RepID=UPI002279C9BB|nr:receptor-like protein 11 [Citrus sinensis]